MIGVANAECSNAEALKREHFKMLGHHLIIRLCFKLGHSDFAIVTQPVSA
jgi:hypothetical protein